MIGVSARGVSSQAFTVAVNEPASAGGPYLVTGADIYELLNEPQLLRTARLRAMSRVRRLAG